ncbi:MAG: hypothetical protein AAF846_22595 [Chloroflexota bacterium]
MSRTEDENLGLALSNSLSSEHLEELAVDFGDLAINSIMDSNILDDVPIVGIFYKSGKAILGIRDRIFLKKISTFLYQHRDIPLEERVNFLTQFETNKQKKEFGETVVMLLDSVNHILKAKIIGRLSRALILGIISKDEFDILCDCTTRIFITDIAELKELYIATEFSKATGDQAISQNRLFNAGLLWTAPSILTAGAFGEMDNDLNRYGKLFVEIGLNNTD